MLVLIFDPVGSIENAGEFVEAVVVAEVVRVAGVDAGRVGVVSAAADCGIDEGRLAIVKPASKQSLRTMDAAPMSGTPFESLQSSQLHQGQVSPQCLLSNESKRVLPIS